MALTDIADHNFYSRRDYSYSPPSSPSPPPRRREVTFINKTDYQVKLIRKNQDGSTASIHDLVCKGSSHTYSELAENELGKFFLEFYNNDGLVSADYAATDGVATYGSSTVEITHAPLHEKAFRTSNDNIVKFDDRNEQARGATAGVFYGVIHYMGRPSEQVAIKSFFDYSNQTENRFIKEVTTNITCQHPNIVRYIDHYQQRGKYGLVMELANSGSLYDLNRSTMRFTPAQQLDIVMDAAHGLKYLHSKHLIHRDIKSSNLLIVRTGDRYSAKWTDFGLSELKKEHRTTILHMSQAQPVSNVASQTQVLRACTIAWAPPEVLDSDAAVYNEKTDIWSFGMVLWEIYLRKIPFAHISREGRIESTIIQSGAKHVNGNDPTQGLSTIPATSIADLIKRCWIMDSGQRPNANEAVAQIEIARGQQVPQ